MDDQTAISRIKQGDPSGLEWLVKTYQVQAVSVAWLIVQDPSIAEEIAQSAFIRTVEKIDQYDQKRSFAPWFFTIVSNEAIKAAHKQARLVSLEEKSSSEAGRLAEWLIDPHPRPEVLIEIKESNQLVREAMNQLTPEQLTSVVMRYYLQMSEAEMSDRMKRPLSTIKWWLRSARERLGLFLRNTHYFEDRE
jgi:RNA polymerase sigma-70 factor (ECF subfamily)